MLFRRTHALGESVRLTEQLNLEPHPCFSCGKTYKVLLEYHMMRSRVLEGRSDNTLWECPPCGVPVMFIGRCTACEAQPVIATLVESAESVETLLRCPACHAELEVRETRFAHP